MPKLATTTTSGKRRRLSVMDRSDRHVLGEISQPASDDDNITLELMKGSPGEPRPPSRRKSSIMPTDRRVSFRDFNTVKTFTPTRDSDSSDEEYDFAPHHEEVSKAVEMFASDNSENSTYSMPNIFSMGRNSVELRLSIGKNDDNDSEDDAMDIDSNTSAQDTLEKQKSLMSPSQSPRRTSLRRSSSVSETMDLTTHHGGILSSRPTSRRTSVVSVASPEDLYKKSGRRMARDSIAPFFAANSNPSASPKSPSKKSSPKNLKASPSKIPVLSPILKKSGSPKSRKNVRDSIAPFFPSSPYQPKKSSRLRYATTVEEEDDEKEIQGGSASGSKEECDKENHTQDSVSMDLSTVETTVLSVEHIQEPSLNRQESDVSATSAGSSWSTVASVEDEPVSEVPTRASAKASLEDDTISRFFQAGSPHDSENQSYAQQSSSLDSTPRKMKRASTSGPRRRSSIAPVGKGNQESSSLVQPAYSPVQVLEANSGEKNAIASEPSSPMTRSRSKALARMSLTSPLPPAEFQESAKSIKIETIQSAPNTPTKRRASVRKSGGLFDTPPKHIQEKHRESAPEESVAIDEREELVSSVKAMVSESSISDIASENKKALDTASDRLVASDNNEETGTCEEERNFSKSDDEDDLMNEHLSVVDESFNMDSADWQESPKQEPQEIVDISEFFDAVGIAWSVEKDVLPKQQDLHAFQPVDLENPISVHEIVDLHCVVASELTTYELACNNIQEDNEGIEAGVKAREDEINREKPLLFFEYSQGSMDEKDDIMAAVQRTETFCQLEAQDSWYEWKCKLLGTRLTDLGKYRAQLFADLNLFEQYNEHYVSAIQEATEKRRELHQKLETIRKEKSTKEESERMRILDLKRQRLEQRERLSQLKERLSQLEVDKQMKLESINELQNSRNELIQDITKCQEICKEITVTESHDLSQLRQDFKLILMTHGWKPIRISNSRLVLRYDDLIQASFEKGSNGSYVLTDIRIQAENAGNPKIKATSPIEIDVVAIFGLDMLNEMWSRLTSALKHLNTIKTITDMISASWGNLKSLASDIRSAKCYFPISVNLSDVHPLVLDLSVDIFSFELKRRYELCVSVSVLEGTPLSVKIEPKFGQVPHELQEWIDGFQEERQKSFKWLSRTLAANMRT